jgi:hypothetical protein
MTKNSNSKQRRVSEFTDLLVSVIGISDFEFICNLVLVYWYFTVKCKTMILCETMGLITKPYSLHESSAQALPFR